MSRRLPCVSWRVGRGLTASVLVTAVIVCGCEPKRRPMTSLPAPPPEPEEVSTVVDRVNANADRMPDDVMLKSSYVEIQAGLIDEDGKETSYEGDGSLYFVKPNYLHLTFKHGLAGRMAEIGSDGERYWLWYKETKKVWWGKYKHLDKPRLRDMPIRPDQLIEALGVTRLPSGFGPLYGAWYRVVEARIQHTLHPQYKLGYLRRTDEIAAYVERDYSVSQVAPFLVERIVFGDKYGRLSGEATLDALAGVTVKDQVTKGPGPMMPHRIYLRLADKRNFLSLKLRGPQLTRIPPKLRPPKWWKMPYSDGKPPPDWQIIQIDEVYDGPAGANLVAAPAKESSSAPAPRSK